MPDRSIDRGFDLFVEGLEELVQWLAVTVDEHARRKRDVRPSLMLVRARKSRSDQFFATCRTCLYSAASLSRVLSASSASSSSFSSLLWTAFLCPRFAFTSTQSHKARGNTEQYHLITDYYSSCLKVHLGPRFAFSPIWIEKRKRAISPDSEQLIEPWNTKRNCLVISLTCF